MLFNDYVRGLNSQYNSLCKLEHIITELKEVLEIAEEMSKNSFKFGYLGLIHSEKNSSSNQNGRDLSTYIVNSFNKIRESLIGIDFMEFGEILYDLKKVDINGLEYKDEDLVNSFKSSYKVIHKYRSSTDANERVEGYNDCINAIRDMIETFNKFRYMINVINSINKELCESIEGEGLEIQLLNHTISKETYSNVVDPVYIIYDKLCEIANVKEELVIVRVETGSLFAKFLGNTSILEVLAKILGTMHDIVVRNFTREGQRKNLAESTELFNQQFNILKEMKEMGFDVNEQEEIARETLGLLMKQSNILLSSSPDIRINERVLSKSEDMKKLLEQNNYNLLAITEEEKIEEN